MARIDVMDILRSKRVSPLEFDFDNMWIPPIYNYLTPQDIEELRKIATSVRLSSKITLKYQMIDNIMRMRGFKRFAAGTNRVVYSFLEDDRFLIKIAVDKVGMQDNPMEYRNQFLLKPYVTKMFYTSQCGTVGFVERVLPIKNRDEFREIAEDVFDIIINKILGKYVVEDIGTKFFMNWGVRMSSGPVLLDYPYIYKLDGNKLYCTKTDEFGNICDGEIDYDSGFNHLVCSKCGKIYLATDLKDDKVDNKIIIKGGSQMKVMVKKGNEVIANSVKMETVIKKKNDSNKQAGNTSRLVVGKENTDHFFHNGETFDGNEKNEEIQEVTAIWAPAPDSEYNDDDTMSTFATDIVKQAMEQIAEEDEKKYEAVFSYDEEDDTDSESDPIEMDEKEEMEDLPLIIPRQPKVKTKPERDNKGRFVSTKDNSKNKKNKIRRNRDYDEE